MADIMPINFPIPAESYTASFDYFDFASGFGYRSLYLAPVQTSPSTVEYILTNRRTPSTVGVPYLASGGEQDFDITFVSPQVIEGDVIISVLQQLNASGSVSAVFTLYHVNGAGTETSIGTVTTPTTSSTGAVRHVCKISAAKTLFAIGEKLRLTLTVNGTNGRIYIDPSGGLTFSETGSSRSITSETHIEVPFVIQQ